MLHHLACWLISVIYFFHFHCYFFKFTLASDDLLMCMDCISFSAVLTEQDSATDAKALPYAGET